MQVLPSQELSPFIKHYLFLEKKGDGISKLRLFSDGNTGIVFSFDNKLITGFGKNAIPEYLPESFLYGQLSDFRDLYAANNSSLLIVVFQPWGISSLTGIPAPALRNKVISLDNLFGEQVHALIQKLYEQPAARGKFRLLNTFVTDLVNKKTYGNQTLIAASVQFISNSKGLITSKQLEKFTGYTERHIERSFMQSIGCTPKKFSNIIKLHYFLKCLKNNSPAEKLTPVAYEAGYADQSHLIKEFKKHTGITPGSYLHNTHKLSVNFIELLAASAV